MSVTRCPEILLNSRMAACVLKVKSMPNYYIVPVSICNYCDGELEAPINFAGLLFDLVSKLQYVDLLQENRYTVIIAGDFNFDITTHPDPFLWQHTHSFVIPHYDVRPLREGKHKIDFIFISKQLESKVKEAQAHNLQIPKVVKQSIRED